jgi:hypothetical protein
MARAEVAEGCTRVRCGNDLDGAGEDRATLVLHGTEQPVLRLDRGRLVVGDEHGRLLVADLEHGQVLRDLRVV